MTQFLFNLSDHKARKAQIEKVRKVLDERAAAASALEETFDPEAGRATDEPFPESDSPEAPAEEAAAEEEEPKPVRLCSVCREPGHTKANCPTLAAEQPVEGGVSELDGEDDTTDQE